MSIFVWSTRVEICRNGLSTFATPHADISDPVEASQRIESVEVTLSPRTSVVISADIFFQRRIVVPVNFAPSLRMIFLL